MKKFYTLLMFGCVLANYSQSKIAFTYDEAGNQTNRSFCLTCLSRSAENTKNISELKPIDMKKFESNDDFSYYPNPVKEELFLQWANDGDAKIININIYTINGSLLKTIKTQNVVDNQNISFIEYPEGVYVINLIFNNGKERVIKILKN